MTDLDLSEWIEMCLHKIYTGPHAEEFIDGVREYEERIRKLEANAMANRVAIMRLEAKLEKAAEALVRIALSDLYSVEANAEDQGAVTLEYAHKSICNLARTTLAELKGQGDES